MLPEVVYDGIERNRVFAVLGLVAVVQISQKKC